MAVKIFRWKAIGPLLLFLAIMAVLLWLFAEPVAEDTTEEVGTELLGTQVDIGKLDIRAGEASVDLHLLEIADPFNGAKNLVEAEEIRLKLNPLALAEKKLVVENLWLGGLKFGTTRKTPAKPVEGDGFAPQALRSVREWARQFDVPILQLTPIDTVRQLVLNPTQLTTVRTAQALAGRADSARKGLEHSLQQLNVDGTVDTARALVTRLKATDPRKLGVDGTRKAVEDTRASLKRLETAKRQVADLERQVQGGAGSLTAGLQSLDEARKKDYAFARGLLKLPTFSAPEIGEAFFGQVSIDRFQQALYYTELARRYMPPGLLPKQDPGPERLRASGVNVRFPKEQDWPKFLVQLGQVDLEIGGDSPLRGAYQAMVQGLTSDPSLYGKPTVIRTSRTAESSAIAGIDVTALFDHVNPQRVRDSASARLRGVELPTLDVPGLPFRLDPGRGAARLDFALRNDQLSGRWSLSSDQVAWALDSTGRKLNTLEGLVWRVVSGLKDLSVDARVSGGLHAPKLAVSSNLDRAIAQRLEAVIGEEVAKAEKMVRAKVDSVVAARVEPVRKQILAVRSEAGSRLGSQRKQLEDVERELQAELKRLSGGLAPDIKLPKIGI
ncbi:MAG TPA: TIGR03545 family protein [Gemmatimonadales bacterium]|nr:TIGR03545 family protein [Gemmatimonadales bacterium]